MTEFQFYKQLDPEAKKKTTYESRTIILNQAQNQTAKWEKHVRVAVN